MIFSHLIWTVLHHQIDPYQGRSASSCSTESSCFRHRERSGEGGTYNQVLCRRLQRSELPCRKRSLLSPRRDAWSYGRVHISARCGLWRFPNDHAGNLLRWTEKGINFRLPLARSFGSSHIQTQWAFVGTGSENKSSLRNKVELSKQLGLCRRAAGSCLTYCKHSRHKADHGKSLPPLFRILIT